MRIWVRQSVGLIMVGAAATVVVLAACTAPAVDVGSAPARPASSAPVPAGGVSPNAPEVNPAGDIPDNQVFVPYAPPGAGFTVSVPEGWARTGTAIPATFTDKFNAIRVEAANRPSAPTVDTERSAPTSATATGPATVTQVTRKSGPAILVAYPDVSPPDPVTGKTVRTAVERYEFWRNGRLVALTLSAPQGADNVDPWRIVTDSFAWTAG